MSGVCVPVSARASAPALRRGFTLVEMLIAIGVIVLLVALTVTAATALLQRSEVTSTQNTLKILDMTIQEFETEVDRKVRLGPVFDIDFTDCSTWELVPDTPDDLVTAYLIGSTVYRRDASRQVFAQVAPKHLLEFQRVGGDRPGWLEAVESYLADPCFGQVAYNVAADDAAKKWFAVLDAWGNPVRTVYPGRVPTGRSMIGGSSVFPDDQDETMRTPSENQFGVCIARRLGFVSAGPDGQWGSLHLNVAESSLTDDQRRDIELAGDNVYSYDLDRERRP